MNSRRALEAVFPDPEGRPSLRWFEDLQRAGKIPAIQIGRRLFYEPERVRAALRRFEKQIF